MAEKDVYLASKSPRRKALLEQLGYRVTVIAGNAHTAGYFPGDEERLAGESPEAYVRRTARTKFAEGLARREALGLPAGAVLAADTVVSLGDEVLGKPADAEEAKAFLRRLSGRAHLVQTTVVAGTSLEDAEERTSTSSVVFRALSEGEIDAYVVTGEPFDKAGGYGIQGLAGVFVERIDGSFTGIMGLPVREAADVLARAGRPVFP